MMSTTTRKNRKVLQQPPPATKLPFDVIMEILLFLPVNSLLRFKSVSKAWRQLITDPYFANLHHSRSIESHSKHLLVLSENEYETNSKFFFFHADSSKLDNVVVERYSVRSFMHRHTCDTCSKRQGCRDHFLVGSSNGLICVFHKGKFALSNPSTRTHRMISCLDLPSSSIYNMPMVYLGFGYDPLSYDYKVLAISCRLANSYDLDDWCLQTLQAMVYSLNSDSWREVSFPQSMMMMIPFLGAERLVFVNNALYWLCKKATITITITCFDIHDETYSEVPWPPVTFRHGDLRLVSFEDNLCAINHKPYRGGGGGVIDMWVMNQYEKMWTKSYVLQAEGGGGLCCLEDVVCRISEHKILLDELSEGLVQYDTSDKSMHKVVIPGLLINHQTITIVQSIPIMLPVK
ncbi:hypothetical protein Dimus_014489 [Dionaea muscipula]